MVNKWLKFGITNLVTLVRVIGIFAIVPVFRLYGGLATFLLSAGCFATDCIDGILARKLKSSTFFGSLFDGISDKLFLIINFILLMSITPIAIVPIVIELGIAVVQGLKYQYNLNVQSNMIGKAKMWVAGIIISLSYLLVDKNFLNYLGADVVTKLIEFDHVKLFSVVLMPLVLAEVLTLGSYIKEFVDEKEELTEDKKEEKIEQEKQVEEELKNKDLQDLLFNHEIYTKYKDYGNLKLVRTLTKKK